VELVLKYLRDLPELSPLIADWYHREWDIPIERSLDLLASRMTTSVPFQVVAMMDDVPVATGGIYDSVGLVAAEPRFAIYKPWLALVYTSPAYRGQGIGAWLCERLDDEAIRLSFSRYYLFTFTAERLYARLGWKEMERVEYKNHEAVVMYNDLIPLRL